MGRKLIDLTHKQYGMLFVIERAEDCIDNKGIRRPVWKCRCDCGNVVYVKGANLQNHQTNSCGCLKIQKSREHIKTVCYKHGDCANGNTRLYRIWLGMMDRCKNTNGKDYYRYGARGITVCDKWLSYPAFKDWALSNGYADGLSIDRIDNQRGYSPDNCRWATTEQQANNRTNNRLYQYHNQTHTIAEWSRILNIPYPCLYKRLVTYGWDFERAMVSKVGVTL